MLPGHVYVLLRDGSQPFLFNLKPPILMGALPPVPVVGASTPLFTFSKSGAVKDAAPCGQKSE
jgi:hypothetical protein